MIILLEEGEEQIKKIIPNGARIHNILLTFWRPTHLKIILKKIGKNLRRVKANKVGMTICKHYNKKKRNC